MGRSGDRHRPWCTRVSRVFAADRPSLLIASRIIASVLNFACVPVIARAIGPEGRGITATVIASAYVIPILVAVGVPTEVRRRAAIGGFEDSVRAARLWALISLVPSTLMALALGQLLLPTLPAQPRLIAIATIAAAPLTVSWMSDNSVLVATGRFRALVLLQVAQPACVALSVLVLWATGAATVTSVLIAYLGGTVVTFVLGLLLNRVPFRGPVGSLWGLHRESIRYAGSSAAEAASNRLDQMLILPLIGPVEAGIYSVAVSVSALPIALGYAYGAAYFPLVARSSGPERARSVSTTAVRECFVVTLLVIGLAALLVPIAIPMVFGPAFAPAIAPTLISLLGSVAMVVGFVATQLLAAEGRGRVMTGVQTLALVVAIGALAVLGPIWGAVGASLASSLGFAVVAVLGSRALGVSPVGLLPSGQALRSGLRVLRTGPGEVGA